MVVIKKNFGVCWQLFRNQLLQSRHASSSTTPFRSAPKTHLRHSYIHCPGATPLTSATLGQVIDRAAYDYSSTEALVFVHQDIRKTWLQVKQEADRLANSFLSLGLERGDRLGIWATNLYEWQLTQYAAAKAGLALVNVNQAYQTNELEYCLKKVGIRTLVAADGFKTSDYYAMLSELLPELANGEPNVPLQIRSERLPQLRDIVMITQERKRGVLRFDDLLDAGKESLSGELERRQAQVDCDDPCSIQFTSGTTGLPKGATLTHHNVVNNMLMMAGRVGFDAGGARICMSVPLYHCFGCVGGSVMAPLHGNTLVFPSPVFNATASLQATQDERCTHMYGTPTMFVDMVNLPELERLDLSTLRSGLVAGAPVPFHLMEAMISKLGMQNSVVAYGLTETSPLLTVGFPSDDVEHRCGTVGYPLDHCELKVVDESGQIAPPNTPGELCARSYSTFLGYWDDAEKTRASLTPQRWFLTG
ncbi:medium-chain acyl-CoA ligase ACSF2, mitochondrial-like isoform X2 [Pollicipes pollicipes]|nr:medium-chain acyl-CoA ligase ACSF2, mitochondrial-like isoform X2 [Pollicipes pollicipes]XP_037092809.1 medium-chain acyl-CoA ligase ACSF2, mitochondrial-like isoform X2 [Pollicipes pollicipes]XP_037092810.1 medium-chain acyl-CoA ligase ACSF2, mitochondrial-like isoform X2 [Pollicipes pollicipes]